MNESDEDARARKLDPSTTARSLRYLLESPSFGGAAAQVPGVHLKRRLEQPDGAAWLDAAFERPPFAPLADARRGLREGTLSLAELTALKERAKSGFTGTQPHDVRLASIAAYFLAIAVALRSHRACITSQPRGELRTLLVDLASAVSEPWSSLLSEAAFTEPSS